MMEVISIFMAFFVFTAINFIKKGETPASGKSTFIRIASECNVGLMRRLQRWIGEMAKWFFSPTSDNCEDPLVDLVRQNPLAAARFIKTVMIISGLGGAFVCACSVSSLLLFWSTCHGCDKPLRLWLLLHTLLQGVQVPVCFVFFARMLDAHTAGGSIEACVSSFTASPAWYSSKKASLLAYSWILVGIAWLMGVGDYTACLGVYRMAVVVIMQVAAREIGAVICYSTVFHQSDAGGGAESPGIQPADPHQISSLPRERFVSDEGHTCAICLCDYDLGDSLLRLPCGHYFHRRCVGQWLKRNKRCPLCMQAIDAATGITDKSDAKRT